MTQIIVDTMNTANITIELLDCGHHPSPHNYITDGAAYDRENKSMCYDCAESQEKADLLKHDKWTAYLTKGDDGRLLLTNWVGRKLATITEHHTNKPMRLRNSRMSSSVTYFRAVDVHGQRWHGQSPGVGMYARMVKDKKQP